MERRLAAILAADVVGYTRLMGEDEAGTLRRLTELRQHCLEPLIGEHRGRVVKLMGDGLLVAFASVVDALSCAVAWQRSMAEREAGAGANKRFQFRIGINLGDVIVENEDVYGDGVNLAARLEALAEPGGILASGTVFEHVMGKVEVGFEDLGKQAVKNFPEPVRVYRVLLDGKPAPASTKAPRLELPDKPSIAVLPLDNMSQDPEQDFLGEGISEDIITALSKFRSLFVIARNSSFSFKGQQLEIREIGERLGVRYVVEGSVRRIGNRVRITAQLIDAVEDKHIWAERYDREIEDIFAVQDEVTLAIVQAIEPHLTSAEQQRALRKPPENLDAWENYQRGMWHLLTYQPRECEPAIHHLKRAVELDPSFARARACLGFAYGTRVLHDISPDRDADIQKALTAGRQAAQIDEYEAFAYLTTARMTIFQRRYDDAIAAADRAIQLNPNFAMAHMIRGHALWHAGRPQEAVVSIDTAIRASPHAAILWVFYASKAIALVMLERFDEAISVSRVAQQHPNAAIYAFLGEMSALGHKGDTQAAADAIKRAKVVKPDVCVGYVEKVLPVADPHCRELFLGGLRKAGLP